MDSRKRCAVGLLACLYVLVMAGVVCAGDAKNIIIMVPDGMGLADVTAARIFKGGSDGEPLAFERLPQIGYQRTHSSSSAITDSAAAASAWACGEKFRNGQISWHNDSKPETILEMAKKRGKATALVVTSTVSHATPAAFAAHVSSRNCEAEIARQYIEETKVDVILGGGIGKNNNKNCSTGTVSPNQLVDLAQSDYGYAYVTNATALATFAQSGEKKVLGLFASALKTRERFRLDENEAYPEGEPTLSEMTEAALDIVERNQDGFFMVVEGSQIDKANHSNDLNDQLSETLGFSEAVETVLGWISERTGREGETLLIVLADHETGGFAVNGPTGTAGPGTIVKAAWTSKQHTAVDTMIWSQGPGSEDLGAAIDNTKVFKVMKDAMK